VASLHEYYLKDFSHDLSIDRKWTFKNASDDSIPAGEVTARLHLDRANPRLSLLSQVRTSTRQSRCVAHSQAFAFRIIPQPKLDFALHRLALKESAGDAALVSGDV